MSRSCRLLAFSLLLATAAETCALTLHTARSTLENAQLIRLQAGRVTITFKGGVGTFDFDEFPAAEKALILKNFNTTAELVALAKQQEQEERQAAARQAAFERRQQRSASIRAAIATAKAAKYYEDAIKDLENAIAAYPDAPETQDAKALHAKYLREMELARQQAASVPAEAESQQVLPLHLPDREVVQEDANRDIEILAQRRWQAQDPPEINRRQQQLPNPPHNPLVQQAPNRGVDDSIDDSSQWRLRQHAQDRPRRQQEEWRPNLPQNPLAQQAPNRGVDNSIDDFSQSRFRQEAQDGRRRQQEEERLQMEKDRIASRAFQLEGRIRNSRNDSQADYHGLSSEATFLSQDSSRVGESGAAWHFGNAASKLQEMERDQNTLMNRQNDSFGSRLDSNRREAERDVWGGGASIDRFGSR